MGTIRTYRHSPTKLADPTGTLVDTEVDADDGSFSVAVDTTGWPPGSYEISVSAQNSGESESAKSNALPLTVQAAASDVSIENGFPLSSTETNIGDNTIVRAGVTTSGPSMIVAVLAGGSVDDAFPATIAGAGLTWASAQDQTLDAGPYQNDHSVQIWYAWSSGALNNQSITATFSSVQAHTAVLSIYSLQNASNVIGSSNGNRDTAGTPGLLQTTINNVPAGALVIGGAVADSITAQTAMAGTTRDAHAENATQYVNPATFHLTSPTVGIGNVTVGSTNNEGYRAVAAVAVVKP